MLTSKISSKGQVALPKEIRESLHATPGDLIEYEVKGDCVLIRRVPPFDRTFYEALGGTLSEWSSPEDEQAFSDL